MFFAFSPFRFRWALEASRWPQDGPREPQDGPKRGPRRAQERPRAPQERPKRAPRGDFSGPDGGTLISARRCFARWPPRWPQEASQTPPKSPTRAPRPPKRAPRVPQESPKRTPLASHRLLLGWAGGDARSVKNCKLSIDACLAAASRAFFLRPSKTSSKWSWTSSCISVSSTCLRLQAR